MVKSLVTIFTWLLFTCLLTVAPGMFAQVAGPAHGNDSLTTPEQQMQQVLLRLQEEYAQKANQLSDQYVKSQQAYYAGNHQQAIQHINQALQLADHADLHAFKGAVLFGMGQEAQAQQAFKKAFSLDDKLPIPAVPGLEAWLRKTNLMP